MKPNFVSSERENLWMVAASVIMALTIFIPFLLYMTCVERIELWRENYRRKKTVEKFSVIPYKLERGGHVPIRPSYRRRNYMDGLN